jgi:ribonuclease HI
MPHLLVGVAVAMLFYFKDSNMKSKVAVESLDFVVYTDGGCKPSYGHGGFGFHGYLYKPEVPKQGSGAKATPTADGYLEGKSGNRAVTVEFYVDYWKSIDGMTTNNVAELQAAIHALRYADENDVKSVLMIVDSKYVMDGLNEWSKNWINNGWKTSAGKDVENKDLWIELIKLRDTLEAKPIEVKLQWTRGHSGDLGNTIVDLYAKRGVLTAQKGIRDEVFLETPAKGYWNVKVDYNRMLGKSCWYFNTNIPEKNRFSPDGRYVYHLGQHGPDDKLYGKRTSDSSFSVVYLKEPDPVLETVRNYQDQVSDGHSNNVIIGRVDQLRLPKHYHEILTYGDRYIACPGPHLDLTTVEKVLLTKDCVPARLAYRGIDTLISLEVILEDYLTGKEHIVVTDVTDEVYQIEEGKKGKVTYKLNPKIGTSERSLSMRVKFDTKVKQGEEDVKLLFDMDIPSRNTLSALASRNPRVKVITWRESDTAFRMASIVEAEDDVGIWSSVHSNLKIVN